MSRHYRRSLVELLESLFTPEQLRRFVALLPNAHAIANELPSGATSLSSLALELVQALERHGQLDAEFFAELQRERPNRAKEIERVSKSLEAASECNPRPPISDPLSEGSHNARLLGAPWKIGLSVSLLASLLSVSTLAIFMMAQDSSRESSEESLSTTGLKNEQAAWSCRVTKKPISKADLKDPCQRSFTFKTSQYECQVWAFELIGKSVPDGPAPMLTGGVLKVKIQDPAMISGVSFGAKAGEAGTTNVDRRTWRWSTFKFSREHNSSEQQNTEHGVITTNRIMLVELISFVNTNTDPDDLFRTGVKFSLTEADILSPSRLECLFRAL